MRTTTRKRSRPGSIPINACPACGTLMRPRATTLKLPVNGEEIAVPGTPHMACPRCGERVLSLLDARRFHQRALDGYRVHHGLLAAEEIRELRRRFGLTQQELARLLHLGGNTVSRWEAGRTVQTGAMDVLLRLLRDIPGSLDYLRKHAA